MQQIVGCAADRGRVWCSSAAGPGGVDPVSGDIDEQVDNVFPVDIGLAKFDAFVVLPLGRGDLADEVTKALVLGGTCVSSNALTAFRGRAFGRSFAILGRPTAGIGFAGKRSAV